MSRVREKRLVVVSLLLMLSAGLFVGLRFEATTDIAGFLPESSRTDYQLSRKLMRSELSRTMILTLGGGSPQALVDASEAFHKRLASDEWLAEQLLYIDAGPPAGLERAIWELYQPRRFSFLAPDEASAKAKLTKQALENAGERLVTELALPTSTLISRTAKDDPLLILFDLFSKFENSRSSDDLRIAGGRFLTSDRKFAVLFIATRASAFDSDIQEQVLRRIDWAFAETRKSFSEPLFLEKSGINRFAVKAKQTIEQDIKRVGLVSTLGLALILIVLFGSLRLLALASVPVGAGVLAGCCAVLLVFGRIHGITIAFGASLLGVSFDYVVHYYCHYAAGEQRKPRTALKAVWPAILLGAGTTALGFVALGLSPFRGLQEVAVFAVTGIAATVAVTYSVLPALMPARIRPSRARDALTRGMSFVLGFTRRNKLVFPFVLALVIGLSAFGLPRLQWNEQFASMGAVDGELLKEENRVRQRVLHAENMHFAVALAADDEEALRINEDIARVLGRAKIDGEIGGFRSIASYLPSVRTQRSVASEVTSAKAVERLRVVFAERGIATDVLAPFFGDVTKPVQPLTYEQLAASPMAALVRPFRVSLDGQVGYLTLLAEVSDAAALKERLEKVKGATYIDQQQTLQTANRAYQQSTFRLLGIGLICVLVLLWVRYRNGRLAVSAFAPAAAGVVVTLAALGLFGIPIDLVALTCLLMVASMGADYGIFLTDAYAGNQKPESALLSVVVAGGSTMFGFGLLALSDHPVLQSIGFTASVGIVACIVLAPVSLFFIKEST